MKRVVEINFCDELLWTVGLTPRNIAAFPNFFGVVWPPPDLVQAQDIKRKEPLALLMRYTIHFGKIQADKIN